MLPSILDIAVQYGLQRNDRSSSKKEIRFKCPFCNADAIKKEKYYLSLNTNDNVFKCWFCGESGGVLKFMALLQNTSVEEVKRQLRGHNTPRQRKLHPAEKLTPDQFKKMEMVIPNWNALKRMDYRLYNQVLRSVWMCWKHYVVEEKRMAYVYFVLVDTSERRIEICREYGEKLSLSASDLMIEFTGYAVGSKKKPEWILSAERFAQACSGKKDLAKTS